MIHSRLALPLLLLLLATIASGAPLHALSCPTCSTLRQHFTLEARTLSPPGRGIEDVNSVYLTHAQEFDRILSEAQEAGIVGMTDAEKERLRSQMREKKQLVQKQIDRMTRPRTFWAKVAAFFKSRY
ncbi:hypothetical protein A4X06_0g9395 [Tilletia controversa]|uniref:Uncharacterized protein n=2 Tax=Tilletia TaxID=13289 RepID=A0A8X7SRX3_9BASI|nr:hypothetical protein CF336_g9327 [Tilletia laevis]KAE8180559.1 hypothetical protein CF328_g9123 [Tilletia controversa]KAE8202386.1 hypothetical protein CF335_g3436 [Tilletia laevis]KAE8236918.1 hypothetical protein A4X06_0g9395 [Tilletia controversa]KAE8237202.1 hypothetical protein A4X03_0g9195 [Tilletia caries]